MKIFFLTAYLGAGGAERVVSLLANKMSQLGHEVGIISLKYNDVFYTIDPKVQLVFPMDHCQTRFSELFWLRRFLKGQKPDVVIPFTEGVYCFTILSLLGTGIPIIASERLDPAAMSPTRKVLKRLLLPYTDWLVVQTQSIKDYFPKKIQKKASIIYNPVNEEVFKSPDGLQFQGANTASSVRSSNTPMEGKGQEKLNRFISVGRLYPQKNQEMMIRAFARVADEFPDWQLVIFGEGPLRAELEFLVSSFKLEGRVLLPGRTEHVIEELRKSKIFCMSSDYEGMSNSMIEAICVGLPIVTTDVSGVKELVQDGVNGFVVPCGDVYSMSNAMLSIIKNSVILCDFANNSFMKRNAFRPDTIVFEWITLIERIVNKE